MIYFDMDGVLYKYDLHMYTSGDWMRVGKHAFLNLPVDLVTKTLFDYCNKVMPNDVCVLTAVSNENSLIRNEQVKDKMESLIRDFSEFDICNFMACSSSKRNTLSRIKGMQLSRTDILIDDYNNNLYAWQNAGGTAVKYLNGINSLGYWPGYYLDRNNDIIDKFISIWQEVNESK